MPLTHLFRSTKSSLTASFSGDESDDAPILNGMRERKAGFWAGGKVKWRTDVVDVHHSVFLDLGVSKLSTKIKDSPLVGRSTENRVGLGYLYRF